MADTLELVHFQQVGVVKGRSLEQVGVANGWGLGQMGAVVCGFVQVCVTKYELGVVRGCGLGVVKGDDSGDCEEWDVPAEPVEELVLDGEVEGCGRC